MQKPLAEDAQVCESEYKIIKIREAPEEAS
jgi:hypothetical protein